MTHSISCFIGPQVLAYYIVSEVLTVAILGYLKIIMLYSLNSYYYLGTYLIDKKYVYMNYVC